MKGPPNNKNLRTFDALISDGSALTVHAEMGYGDSQYAHELNENLQKAMNVFAGCSLKYDNAKTSSVYEYGTELSELTCNGKFQKALLDHLTKKGTTLLKFPPRNAESEGYDTCKDYITWVTSTVKKAITGFDAIKEFVSEMDLRTRIAGESLKNVTKEPVNGGGEDNDGQLLTTTNHIIEGLLQASKIADVVDADSKSMFRLTKLTECRPGTESFADNLNIVVNSIGYLIRVLDSVQNHNTLVHNIVKKYIHPNMSAYGKYDGGSSTHPGHHPGDQSGGASPFAPHSSLDTTPGRMSDLDKTTNILRNTVDTVVTKLHTNLYRLADLMFVFGYSEVGSKAVPLNAQIINMREQLEILVIPETRIYEGLLSLLGITKGTSETTQGLVFALQKTADLMSQLQAKTPTLKEMSTLLAETISFINSQKNKISDSDASELARMYNSQEAKSGTGCYSEDNSWSDGLLLKMADNIQRFNNSLKTLSYCIYTKTISDNAQMYHKILSRSDPDYQTLLSEAISSQRRKTLLGYQRLRNEVSSCVGSLRVYEQKGDEVPDPVKYEYVYVNKVSGAVADDNPAGGAASPIVVVSFKGKQFRDTIKYKLWTFAPQPGGPAEQGRAGPTLPIYTDLENALDILKKHLYSISTYVSCVERSVSRFYDTVVSLDMYLKDFTDGLESNMEALREMESVLTGLEYNDNWYTEDSGNMLCQVFDKMSVSGNTLEGNLSSPQGEANKSVKTTFLDFYPNQHYYELLRHDRHRNPGLVVNRLHMSAPLSAKEESELVTAPLFPGTGVNAGSFQPAYVEYIKQKFLSRFIANWRPLNNLFNAFASIGSRFGDSINLQGKNFMRIKDLYQNVCSFMVESAFVINDSNMRIEFAQVEGESGGGRRPTNMLSDELKLLPLMLKAVCAKVLTTLNIHKKLISKQDPLIIDSARIILGGKVAAGELGDEDAGAAPNERATHLYYLLPLLIRWYALLFSDGDSVSSTITSVISYLPNQIGIWSDLIKTVFLATSRTGYTPPVYSKQEVASIVQSINKIHSSYSDKGSAQQKKQRNGEADDSELTRTIVSDLIREVTQRFGVINKKDVADFYSAEEQSALRLLKKSGASLESLSATLNPAVDASDPSATSMVSRHTKRYLRPIDDDQPRPMGKNPLDGVAVIAAPPAATDMFNMDKVMQSIQMTPKSIMANTEETGLDRNSYELVKNFRMKLALLFKVGHKNYKNGIVESNILSHAKDMFSKAKTPAEKMDAADYIINVISKYDTGGVSSSDLSDVMFKELVVTNLRALYAIYKFLTMLTDIENTLKPSADTDSAESKAGLVLLLTVLNESDLFDVTISNGISPISVSFANLSKTVSEVFSDTFANFEKIYPTLPNKDEYTRYVDANFPGSVYFLEKNFYNVWFKQESKTQKPPMFANINAKLNVVFSRLFQKADASLLGLVVPASPVTMKRESATASLTGVAPGMYNNFEGAHGDPIPADIYRRFVAGSTDPAEPFGVYDISGSSVPTSRDIITEFNDIVHKIIVNSVDNKQNPKLYTGIHDALSRIVAMSDAVADPDNKTIPDIPGMNLYRNRFYTLDGDDRRVMFSPLEMSRGGEDGKVELFDSQDEVAVARGPDGFLKPLGREYVVNQNLRIRYGLPRTGVVMFRSVANLFTNFKYASVRNRTARYAPRDITQSLLVENLSDVNVNLKYKLRTYIPLYMKMLGALVARCDTLLSILGLNTVDLTPYRGLPEGNDNDIRHYVTILKGNANESEHQELVREVMFAALDSSRGVTIPTAEDGVTQIKEVFHSTQDAPPMADYLRDMCNAVRDAASTLQSNLADVEKEMASTEKFRFIELGNGFLDNQLRLYKTLPFAPPSILLRWMNVFALSPKPPGAEGGGHYISDPSLFPVHNPSSANYKLLYTISRIVSSHTPTVPDMAFPYMEGRISEFNQKNSAEVKLGRSWFKLFRFFVDAVAYQSNYSTSGLFAERMEKKDSLSESAAVGYFTYGGSALKVMMEASPEAVIRYLDPGLAPRGGSAAKGGQQDMYYGSAASTSPGGVADTNKSMLLLQKMLATLPDEILNYIKDQEQQSILAYSVLYSIYVKQRAATAELLRNFSSGQLVSKAKAVLASAAPVEVASKDAGFSAPPEVNIHPATECLFVLGIVHFLEHLLVFYDKATGHFKQAISNTDYSTIVGMVGQYCAPIVFRETHNVSPSAFDQTVTDFLASHVSALGSFLLNLGERGVMPPQEAMFIILDKYKVMPFGLQANFILNTLGAGPRMFQENNARIVDLTQQVRGRDQRLLAVAADSEFFNHMTDQEVVYTNPADEFITDKRKAILELAYSSSSAVELYAFLVDYQDKGVPVQDSQALSEFALQETKIRAERMNNVSSLSKVLADISYLDKQEINLFNPTEVATVHRVFTHYNIMPINVHALRSTIPLANIYNYSVTFDDMIKVHLGIKHPKDSSRMVMSEDRVLWEWYEHMQNPYRTLTASGADSSTADTSKVIIALALATMPALSGIANNTSQVSTSLLDTWMPPETPANRFKHILKGQTRLGIQFLSSGQQQQDPVGPMTDEHLSLVEVALSRCDMEDILTLVSDVESIETHLKLPRRLIDRLVGVPYRWGGDRILEADLGSEALLGAGAVWYNGDMARVPTIDIPRDDAHKRFAAQLHTVYSKVLEVLANPLLPQTAFAAYSLLEKFVQERGYVTPLAQGERGDRDYINASKNIASFQAHPTPISHEFGSDAQRPETAENVTFEDLMTKDTIKIPINFEDKFLAWAGEVRGNAEYADLCNSLLDNAAIRPAAVRVGKQLVPFMSTPNNDEPITEELVRTSIKAISKTISLCDVAAFNKTQYMTKEEYDAAAMQFAKFYSAIDFANLKTDRPTVTRYNKPNDVTATTVLQPPANQVMSRILAFLIDKERAAHPDNDYSVMVNEMWSLANPSKIRTIISALSDSGVGSTIVDSGSINLFVQSQIRPRLGLNRPRFLFDDVFSKVIFTLNATSPELVYGSSQKALEYLDQSNQKKFVSNVDDETKKDLDAINSFRLNTILLRCSIFTTNLFRSLVTIMDKTLYTNTAMVKRGAAATQLSMVEQPGQRDYY